MFSIQNDKQCIILFNLVDWFKDLFVQGSAGKENHTIQLPVNNGPKTIDTVIKQVLSNTT